MTCVKDSRIYSAIERNKLCGFIISCSDVVVEKHADLNGLAHDVFVLELNGSVVVDLLVEVNLRLEAVVVEFVPGDLGSLANGHVDTNSHPGGASVYAVVVHFSTILWVSSLESIEELRRDS
jgi:hypothetical protein